MKSWFREVFLRHAPEQFLFYTHTPGDWCAPGVVRDDMLITELKPSRPTALNWGGTAPCWEVWGKPVAKGGKGE